jgi:protein-disulfide isomerase
MTTRLVTPVDAQDHVLGPLDAPVTLVEYGDYQCPSCGQAYPILKRIQQDMGNALRFVFRNFPITASHPQAEHAAEVAESAGAQDQFWEMHDALYENQDALDDSSLLGYAQALGLDVGRIERELAEHRYRPRVRDDFRSGARSGVNGTPTFFVNGARYDGDWTDEAAFTSALRPDQLPRKEGGMIYPRMGRLSHGP